MKLVVWFDCVKFVFSLLLLCSWIFLGWSQVVGLLALLLAASMLLGEMLLLGRRLSSSVVTKFESFKLLGVRLPLGLTVSAGVVGVLGLLVGLYFSLTVPGSLFVKLQFIGYPLLSLSWAAHCWMQYAHFLGSRVVWVSA